MYGITVLLSQDTFAEARTANKDDEVYDIVIVGAGPAGMTAGIDYLEVY